jgi:hypothetical protein
VKVPKVLEELPPLMAALKEELRVELLAAVQAGQWVDGEHSVLSRNKHIALCKRLIREDHEPPRAYYDAATKVWWARVGAVDAEVTRLNRLRSVQLREPAKAPALPRPAPEDDYEREMRARWGCQ